LVGENASDAAGCGRSLEEFAPGGASIRWGVFLGRGHGSGALNVTGYGTNSTDPAFDDKPGGMVWTRKFEVK
jgi:hypothetical protein